jgi:hypothetical protein
MNKRSLKSSKVNLRVKIRWQTIQRWPISTVYIQVKQSLKEIKETKLVKESNLEKIKSIKFRTIKIRLIQRKTRTSPRIKLTTQVQRTKGNRPLLRSCLRTRQRTRVLSNSRTTLEANRISLTRAMHRHQGKSSYSHLRNL